MSPCFVNQLTLKQEKIATRNNILSKGIKLSLIVFLIFLGVMYLMKTSSVSTKGYEINDLKNKIQELEYENQRLDFEIANYRSMRSIQERLKDMNLVVATDVKYVNLTGSAMAMR